MIDEIPNEPANRRSFLGFAVFGVGAIFSAILGFPVLCYVIDPRHRKGPKSAMKLVDGVKLDELAVNKPAQGVVRDTRTDAWTLYPNDVIGRVWVVRIAAAAPPLATPAEIQAFNKNDHAKKAFMQVFTTICPHLGCSVNENPAGGFLCPCHAAAFGTDGKQQGEGNPALRGMDDLEWEIDEEDSNRIKVTYVNYKTLEATRIPLG